MDEVKTTIRKIDGEYQVRLWVNGKLQEDSTYFTDDKQDAEDTAKDMKKRREENK